MERNPDTGYFLPGNQVAVGNKGNTDPKWGNKNALKHGFFQTFIIPRIEEDGSLVIYKRGLGFARIQSEGWYQDDDWIWLRDDVKELLERMGYRM